MNSSRESNRQIVLFFATLFIFGVGVRFYLKKIHQAPTTTATPVREVASKPAQDGVKVQFQVPVKKVETPAVEHTEKPEVAMLEEEEHVSVDKVSPPPSPPSQLQSKPAAEPETKPEPKLTPNLYSGFIFDEKDEKRAFSGSMCGKVEYAALGVKHAQISPKEWEKVLAQFEKSKSVLRNWLKNDAHQFSEETIAFLQTQLEGIRIEKPPVMAQPDLSWRGIGVFSRNEEGSGSILLSPGFVKMVLRKPSRGAFEFTRLIAQAWAPCELEKADLQTAWDPLLKCLDVQDPKGCSSGGSSETGWAVSSSLATVLSPTDCKLPVFDSKDKFACLKAHLGVQNQNVNPRIPAGKGSHE